MTRSLIFNVRAEKDLAAIQDYYNKISGKLTENFFEELFPKLDFILEDPDLFQIRYRSVRILPLQRFPYGIHYRIKGDKIIVLRILHFRRYFKQ